MEIIPFSRPTIGAKEGREVLATLKSGWLTSGQKVAIFQRELSRYLECRFVRVLDSCTSALELAVKGAGIKKGDEVITTPLTFCATINAIIHSGARPIFADIDINTLNINPIEINKRITKKTKAIMVMHYGGQPCEMDSIIKIARRNKLAIIADAAHAIGASYDRKMVGNISDITCFSFHAAKNITTGEGGAITTNNKKIIDFINKAYYHGIDKESWHRESKASWKYNVTYAGYKHNMSDIHASLGIQQLKKIRSFIVKRKRIAAFYDSIFKQEELVSTQKIGPKMVHAHHLYPAMLDIDNISIGRDAFIEKLKMKSIIPSVHFIPIYKHSAFKNFFTKAAIAQLPKTEYAYQRIITLPIYPTLGQSSLNHIARVMKSLLRKYQR
ncbi:DegT/DnrJ/EryC1/StrS family aminotransferase [Candidatus Omnitrophota bacterium]